jgi:hypothetical protein
LLSDHVTAILSWSLAYRISEGMYILVAQPSVSSSKKVSVNNLQRRMSDYILSTHVEGLIA